MSTLSAYNVLTKMGQLEPTDDGARLIIQTLQKYTLDEAMYKAKDIESLMAEYGVNLVCDGGTIANNSVSFELRPLLSS